MSAVMNELVHLADGSVTATAYVTTENELHIPTTCYGCGRDGAHPQAFILFTRGGEPFRAVFVWCGRRSCTSRITSVTV
jgi:hypothetical protein